MLLTDLVKLEVMYLVFGIHSTNNRRIKIISLWCIILFLVCLYVSYIMWVFFNLDLYMNGLTIYTLCIVCLYENGGCE